MACGEAFGTDAVFYRHWNGDRDAGCRQHRDRDRVGGISDVRVLYVLQMSREMREKQAVAESVVCGSAAAVFDAAGNIPATERMPGVKMCKKGPRIYYAGV